MRCTLFFIALALAAGIARCEDTQSELERLKSREESPAFRRAVVAYQTIREIYESAHERPAIRPLFEVMEGYGNLVDSLAGSEPQVAAAALDRVLQIGFLLGERDRVMDQLGEFEKRYPAVAEKLHTLGNFPPDIVCGDRLIEVRGLEVGELEDEEIVRVAFEARSLSGAAERLAMDLRVMNPTRNYQTSYFFVVPARGWKRYEITLKEMFLSHDRETFATIGYQVPPGDSVVRMTFGTVPDQYQGRAHSDVAFENQFYQGYYVRRPRD